MPIRDAPREWPWQPSPSPPPYYKTCLGYPRNTGPLMAARCLRPNCAPISISFYFRNDVTTNPQRACDIFNCHASLHLSLPENRFPALVLHELAHSALQDTGRIEITCILAWVLEGEALDGPRTAIGMA